MTRRLPAATLLASSLILAGACERGGTDAGGRAAVPPFDADRAFGYLVEQVAFGPRVPGTPAHRDQLDWMHAFLRERADTVVVQEFAHVSNAGGTVPMANVFARFRPAQRERILLVAHWDTRPMADRDPDPANRERPIPGANDGASGVAVLLELANVLSSHSPPIGVDLLFTDGEDYGPGEMYLGAKYFAENLPDGYRPLYAIVVDMVGDRDPSFPIEQYSQHHAPEVVNRVWRVAEQVGYGHRFPVRLGPAIQDDHLPLNEAGIPAIVIIDFEYGPGNRYWHTVDDDVQNTGPAGLEAVGTVLSALIARGG